VIQSLPCCGFTGLQAIYKKNGVLIGGNTAMFSLKFLNRERDYHAFSIRKFT
jgi:hypothetical protein